jgi:signal transduction histidine kinase
MVVWWGPQLIMLYNDAWQPILGDRKHPGGMGRPGVESWPETWAIVGTQFENALRGTPSWSEDLLLASDRSGFLQECYFTYSHSPLRDASGLVVGVLTVVSETTARVLTERRLRVLRDLSNASLSAANELLSTSELCRLLIDLLCEENPDVPFAVQYLTEEKGWMAAVSWAGVEPSRFPARLTAMDDDDWGIGESLRTSRHVVIDVSALPASLPGGVWPEPTTQVVSLPLHGASGPVGVLLVGVSSRLEFDAPYLDFLRLVAAQLAGAVSALDLIRSERQARIEAERAARVKEEFLAMLSHELRTPLHAVVGWTHLLKVDPSNPARIAAAVEAIERNAGHQSRLITDLLDLSRISSGQMQLNVRILDVAPLVEAAVETLMPTASTKGVGIACTIDPSTHAVAGDAPRIQQMLSNLLVNAVRFTSAGGQVTIAVRNSGGYVSLAVRDNGAGIDPAFLPHIFEGFRQADGSLTRQHGGLGLGLALVKRFAELHGGRVHADSDGLGQGATFTLELPKASERDAVESGGPL